MDEYDGRILDGRYRLPRSPVDEFEPAETRAFDTYSGQEVLARRLPLPEIVDAEVDGGGPRADDAGYGGESARRALAAARAAADLPDHPRLVQVFDVLIEDGGLWVVSELVPGRPVADLLAATRLSPYRAVEVAADLLAGLRAVHAWGWAHRNVTPDTVLVCDDGRAMLDGMAFGAAQDALCGYDPVPSRAPGDDGDPETGARTGAYAELAAERARQVRFSVVGPVTERWSPEQAAGAVRDGWRSTPPVGPAADLWALGALLFRCVQGYAPFPEESSAELAHLVCVEPPADAHDCGPLRPLVESLLRQDPVERPDSEELGGWLTSLVRSAPEPGVGNRGVQVPSGYSSDPAALPVKRRRGEVVRRRGRRERTGPSRPAPGAASAEGAFRAPPAPPAQAGSAPQPRPSAPFAPAPRPRPSAQAGPPALPAASAPFVPPGHGRHARDRGQSAPPRPPAPRGVAGPGKPPSSLAALGIRGTDDRQDPPAPQGYRQAPPAARTSQGPAGRQDAPRRRGPLRAGLLLLAVILLALLALVLYAMRLGPHRSTGPDRSLPASVSAGGTDGSGPAPAASASRRASTGGGTGTRTSPPAAPTPTLGEDFSLREDPAGFTVAVHNGWSRSTGPGRETVFASGGGVFRLIVVRGRDRASAYGGDPIGYETRKERELAGFRASAWSSSSGLRSLEANGSPAAEGQFSWRDGGSGAELFAENLAVLRGGAYDIVLLIGPDDQRQFVSDYFTKSEETFRADD